MKAWGALAVILMVTTSVAMADAVYDIPVTSVDSMDLQGDSSNVVWTIDVATAVGLPAGTPVVMNGVAWNLTLTSYPNSTMSESMMYFDDNVAPDWIGLYLRPATGQGAPGTGTFSSGGLLDLTDDIGIPDVPLPNGVLRLEFFEDSKDDFPNAADATWSDGTISVQVTPEPASLLLLAAAGLLLRRR